MHIRLPILGLLAAASLLALPAGAQTVAARAEANPPVTSPAAARPAAAPLDLKRSVALHTATPAPTVHAAGSVLLLADGIVADARIAPLAPPAPGFVYER